MRLFWLAVALSCWPCFCQDAGQSRRGELEMLSSTIAGNLESLRRESEAMELQLTQLQETLSRSESERLRLEEQSSRLSSSLTLINGQLSDSYRTLTAYEERLRTQGKVVMALLAVLGVRLAGMVAGYILYAKGIRLPRWLDILL